MSQLQTISEPIKIPYPTEGVIRTANIDDTVTPENSVQLAVNMKFDRIGAIETRPGVTSFADTLVDGINNYGTLKNSILPPGYETISTLGETSDFSTPARFLSAAKVDDDHIIVFWVDNVTNNRKAQVMLVSQETGGVVPVGTAFVFYATLGTNQNTCIRINSTHFMNIWGGDASTDVYAQVFAVNATTFEVTAAGTAFNFSPSSSATTFGLQLVDSNHVIAFYNRDTNQVARILEINLSTWAITQPGSLLTYEATAAGYNKAATVDSTHFLNTWNGKIQCFSVNTGTWAITAIGTALTYDNSGSNYASLVSVGDGTHFINFFKSNVTVNAGIAQVFTVNLSTFAVTTVGTPLQFASLANSNAAVSSGDCLHFVNFWEDGTNNGYTQIFAYNAGTFAITAVGTPLSIGSMDGVGTNISPVLMSQYKINAVWTQYASSSSAQIGSGALFRLRGALVNGKYLYAESGDEIFNTQTTVWVSRRSGLSQASKARFAQYLNYIWMVNGNESIGGDPVATSNGGSFGTDLVPDNFPPGDFISAGFEGRVWVLDKYKGLIYFTDIVQFTAPDVYTLSYNPDVNFISTISPQTGQQFTGVKQVPRALLVFTEDNIYRIYGASSIDAYPAYNVGTYSQESIVETKTGIFFHHSSGFYQFDYGSQPVEISRRIIDFVKAIPRSNYENIVGVYDGFDAVEWAVGPVTVEGVTFTSCVVRYTISTQVWTIYDYVGHDITAMIQFDNGTTLNHLMGTDAGLTGAMDSGVTDFGEPFYYEYIDRWRAFTDSYAKQKNLDGINVYSENAGGASLMYQIQKSGPNAWQPLGTITELNNSVMQDATTDDFDVLRFRIAGTTKGTPVVIHGIEIMSLTIKGYDKN